MSNETENMAATIKIARELADPDWSLSVPKVAKDVLTKLADALETAIPNSAADMEEVLAEHIAFEDYACRCGWDTTPGLHQKEYPAHVAQELTKAGCGIRRDAWSELTLDSPRLPHAVRSIVFEAVGDIIDKFNFPVQNMGIHPTAVELGDVCGSVEKRIVAIIRAATSKERNSDVHRSVEGGVKHDGKVTSDSHDRRRAQPAAKNQGTPVFRFTWPWTEMK